MILQGFPILAIENKTDLEDGIPVPHMRTILERQYQYTVLPVAWDISK